MHVTLRERNYDAGCAELLVDGFVQLGRCLQAICQRADVGSQSQDQTAVGELLEVHVSRSSGSAILDLASVDIIQRASPFDEFPAAMAEEYDRVAFEYKFLFAERLVPRD